MKRARLLAFLTLAACSALCGQQATEATLPIAARWVAVGPLGHLYLVGDDNSIGKYAADGSLIVRWSGNRQGLAERIDASNPQRILVWFADFRKAAFLDRNLTPMGELDLIAAGYPETRAIAQARDGNLWIFDEPAGLLRKITPEGAELLRSQPLNQLLDRRVAFDLLTERDNLLIAFDPDIGIAVFDIFGQFQYTCAARGAAAVHLGKEGISWIGPDGRLHTRPLRPTPRPPDPHPLFPADKAPPRVFLFDQGWIAAHPDRIEVRRWAP
ncbi:MAG: hypothetical protein ACK4NS_12675 [Saprospiraceae bacterium]